MADRVVPSPAARRASPAPRGIAYRLTRAVVGASPSVAAATVLLIFACGLLLAGLLLVSNDTRYAFEPGRTLDAIASQLPTTGVAAILVAVVTLANLVAGMVIVRLLAGVPYRSAVDMALGGFAGAVLVDVVALFLFGAFGLFIVPVLVAIHLLVYVAAWWVRPLAIGIRVGLPRDVPLAWWPIVLVVWAAPIMLQLASPAVPFMDVLPNHVAPVEHLRAYGSFDSLTVMPSPIYGPSRLFLGYVGVLGTVSVLTSLQAILAVAAFALPTALLSAIAVHQLAGTLFGRRAGYWAVLTFAFTFVFLRLPDARATVVVFPLAAWALSLVGRELNRADVSEASEGRLQPGPVGASLRLAAAFGAAILVHPVVGALCVATAVLAAVVRPDRLARLVIPAAAGASAVALPQLWTMLAFSLPAWVGLPTLALAVALTAALARSEWPRETVRKIAIALLAIGVLAFVLIARWLVPQLSETVTKLTGNFPLLTVAAIGAAIVLLRRRLDGWMLLGSGLVVGLGVEALSQLLPGKSILVQSMQYELPKTIGYWTPVLLSIGAAAAFGEFLRPGRAATFRFVAVAAALVIATVPLLQPSEAAYDITERSYATTIADNLREAERGYWVGYRDPRLIIDADGRGVVDFLRAEQRAGRLGPTTPLLHVAASFQQWSSIPVGVFTGAMETTITLDPEKSIHTAGGRLYGFKDLSRLLGTTTYVVYEPKDLPNDYEAQIVAAGFRQVYSNRTAFVFIRG